MRLCAEDFECLIQMLVGRHRIICNSEKYGAAYQLFGEGRGRAIGTLGYVVNRRVGQ